MVQPLPKDEIETPPRSLLQYYLSLSASRPDESKPGEFDTSALEAITSSAGAARQVAHHWTKYHLALRLRFGTYALVDPSVAIRAWAIPRYYAELLTLHDVLKTRKVPHAFACLTAATNADYVAERPLLVTRRDEERKTERLDAIRYDYPRAHVSDIDLDVLGEHFSVPMLSNTDAAVVLAAMGTAREVQAAKQLAQSANPTEIILRRLNHFGVRLDPAVFRAEDPHVKLPDYLEKRRAQLANSLLAEGVK